MARWTLDWLRARGVEPRGQRVADWGCGDGAAALLFAAAGCVVTGVDRAPAMLELARQRPLPPGSSVEWRLGDLRDGLELERGLLATAFYDTLNYLTSTAELAAAWQTLARSVQPGGYVVADLNTPYEYASAWDGRHVITADTDEILVTNWLRYSQKTRLARGRILWFVREPAGQHWRRGWETHRQRAHSEQELRAAIEQAGLRLIERCTPQGEAPTAEATRLIYIAQA